MINTNIQDSIQVSTFIENPTIRALTPINQLKRSRGIMEGKNDCLFPVYQERLKLANGNDSNVVAIVNERTGFQVWQLSQRKHIHS